MKRITITLTFLLFLLLSVKAQTIHYLYDTSGNRVNRCSLKVEKVTLADSATIVNEETKDLADERIVGLRIYPNPVNTIINIELATLPETQLEYILSDINGKLLEEGRLLSTLTHLNLQNIRKGIYLLVIKEESKIEEFKIVKQ